MVNYILSKMIINNIIDENELDNYHYALEVLFLKMVHFIMIIGIGLYFNILIETIIFLYIYCSVRKYIGGYHSKNLYICLLLSVLFIVFLELLLTYKEFFDEKIIFLVIFIGLCYFYQHCKNYFLTKIKNNMVFIIISSAFLLILAQKDYLISIAYAIVLNFFLFKLSKI